MLINLVDSVQITLPQMQQRMYSHQENGYKIRPFSYLTTKIPVPGTIKSGWLHIMRY